jgi:hypothetical protein
MLNYEIDPTVLAPLCPPVPSSMTRFPRFTRVSDGKLFLRLLVGSKGREVVVLAGL